VSCTSQARQIAFVKAFSTKQHELGVFGSVGEIGVHHGKFLIPLVGNALRAEPAVAIDLFEDQSANVDTSGVCVAFVVCLVGGGQLLCVRAFACPPQTLA
jgi:hypothetical protein